MKSIHFGVIRQILHRRKPIALCNSRKFVKRYNGLSYPYSARIVQQNIQVVTAKNESGDIPAWDTLSLIHI